MKNPLKTLLLAAATVAVASSGQAANGDLIAGFDHGSGNTLVYNLGTFTSLFDGKTWNIGTSLIGAGFDSLNPGVGIKFGVVGYQNTGSTLYSTISGVDGGTDFNGARASVQGMTTAPGVQARDGGNQSIDWYTQTESHFASGSWFANTLTDPNGTAGNSLLLDRTTLGSYGVNSFGTFSLANDGTLSYSAVPEPSTIGLVGGLGVLFLSFRRKSLKA